MPLPIVAALGHGGWMLARWVIQSNLRSGALVGAATNLTMQDWDDFSWLSFGLETALSASGYYWIGKYASHLPVQVFRPARNIPASQWIVHDPKVWANLVGLEGLLFGLWVPGTSWARAKIGNTDVEGTRDAALMEYGIGFAVFQGQLYLVMGPLARFFPQGTASGGFALLGTVSDYVLGWTTRAFHGIAPSASGHSE